MNIGESTETYVFEPVDEPAPVEIEELTVEEEERELEPAND